jgi:hypothetical protein
MARSSKSFIVVVTKWMRKFLATPLRELSRTGKIVQTLWDAAQLQSQQRAHYQRVGEIAISLVREGRLQNMQIERTMAKIEQIERILRRQELLMKSYQQRGDVREVLKVDRQQNKDRLEPV